MKPGVYVGGVALLAAAIGMGFWLARQHNRELAAQVTRLSRQNAELRYELKQAATQAADIGRRAVELDSLLGSAKIRGTATETRNDQLVRELSAREQREVALMAELASLRQAPRPAAPPEPAPVVSTAPVAPASPTPPLVDVAPYERRIAELEDQLTRLLTRALAETLEEPAPPATIPAAPLPHQVVRVGPADTFVVIDYGAVHGARPQALIRLQRGTSELAQVQISDVRPRFSLARVLPGTLKGQLQTGDLLVFTP
ncbi:MAG: hypothetical protein JNG82_00870 [Opitutaceae bacterium]|nr:hypothetical protein [Opitutaceae bacterium]